VGVLDKLRNELAAAIAIAGGVMLGTGWALTWARLSSEQLPTESTITALPVTYFVQIAVRSTLLPVLLLLSVGTLWIWVNVWRMRVHRPKVLPYISAWAAFGLGVSGISLLSSRRLNAGSSGGEFAYWGSVCLAALAVIAMSAAGAWWLEKRRLPEVLPEGNDGDSATELAEADRWKLVRAIGAITIVLCFVSGSVFRVLDARHSHDVLPIATVLIKTPCVQLTMYGIPSQDEAKNQPPKLAATSCELAGFYLGEGSQWVFLMKRPNPCPGKEATPAFLLTIPRDDIQQMAVYRDRGCSAAASSSLPDTLGSSQLLLPAAEPAVGERDGAGTLTRPGA
jgi:hypothetical protein